MFWDDPDGEVFDSIVDVINEVMGVIGDMPEGKQVDLEGFVEKSSGAVDRLIIEKIRQGNEFVAGRFNLVCIDDGHFKFTIEMYFRDPHQNDYIHLEGESRAIPMKILKENAREELKLRQMIAYEVNAPILPGNDSTTGRE